MNIFRAIALLFGRRKVRKHVGGRADLLIQGSIVAEARLGLPSTYKQIEQRLVIGKIFRGGDRWGIIDPWGREVGGYCENRGNGFYRITIVTGPDGIPKVNRIAHEVGHVLCYEAGIKEELHHDTLVRHNL